MKTVVACEVLSEYLYGGNEENNGSTNPVRVTDLRGEILTRDLPSNYYKAATFNSFIAHVLRRTTHGYAIIGYSEKHASVKRAPLRNDLWEK